MKKEFIVITILIFAILYFIREKKNQILARALIWKGVKETGTNAGFTNDIFQKMMKNVGWSSGSQWCAYFVKMVYIDALPQYKDDFNKVLSGRSQATFSNVENGKSKYLKAIKSGPCQPGDIVIWTNKNDSSRGHAGIVYSVNGNNFVAIEGNTNTSPARYGNTDLVQLVDHQITYGTNDNTYKTKKLRGFIRLK